MRDDAGPTGAPGPAPPPASGFDVCHVGVVLRTVLFVHAAVSVALLFQVDSLAGLPLAAATGAGVALPGALLWLLLACGCKRWLGALPPGAQAPAAMALGAAAAMGGGAPAWFLGGDPPGALRGLALALAGAGLSLVVFQWLQLRVRATLPAATTARLAELQSRIRPHFLFNTLNTALALVRLDPARAETVLEDLAELFRVAIGEGSAESVTLAEEVELARRYLAIEQLRFGDRLALTWDLDPLAGSARLPPLLLQPLVENAVRHGVEPADEGGSVRVRTRVRAGRAVVSIDNSVPASASVSVSASSTAGHGMALRNVRERLRLMHDVAAEFDTRRDARVFRVRLVVPLPG